MTRLQMERAIKNLQIAVSNLAEKSHDAESSNNDKIIEVESTVITSNSVTDMILTDIIPDAEGKIVDINETIDMILTEVIPSLMGDE